jgi:hypothetical protein
LTYASGEVFSIADETFSSLGAKMAVPRRFHAMVVDNAKLYVVSGEDAYGVLKSVEVYVVLLWTLSP